MRLNPSREHYRRPDAVEMTDPDSSAFAFFSGTPERPVAAMFSGKRQRPDANYRYSSEARRAAAWTEHCENVRRREAYQAEQREQRKAVTRANASLSFEGQTYLSAAAVGALLRQALKESFPGHRFSVTSDGSLRVKWTDGPTRKQVERIAKQFEGSYFDGMIDYKGSLYHSLDGRRVSFGCDFVFCERSMSREALEAGAVALAAHYPGTNHAPALFEVGSWGGLIVKANPDFPGACESSRIRGEVDLMGPESEDFDTGRLHRAEYALELWFDTLDPVAVQPSPTFARVALLGSDGYGNTIDTPEGKPAGAGYPQPKEADPVESNRMRAALDLAGADLVAELERIAASEGMAWDPDAARFVKVEPPARKVACEVIDFAPHLAAHIARAEAARRIN